MIKKQFCFSDEDAIKFSHQLFTPLMAMLSNAKVSSWGRDNIMELLIKYVTKKDGLNWSRNYIDEGGEYADRVCAVCGWLQGAKIMFVTQQYLVEPSNIA